VKNDGLADLRLGDAEAATDDGVSLDEGVHADCT
jgi:hypothetical protein